MLAARRAAYCSTVHMLAATGEFGRDLIKELYRRYGIYRASVYRIIQRGRVSTACLLQPPTRPLSSGVNDYRGSLATT